MKKIIAISIILSFVGLSFFGAGAADGPYQKGERGVMKIVKSPLGVSDSVSEVSKKHNVLFGMTFGLIEGSVKLVTDVISGAADIITAPIGSYDKEIKPMSVTSDK